MKKVIVTSILIIISLKSFSQNNGKTIEKEIEKVETTLSVIDEVIPNSGLGGQVIRVIHDEAMYDLELDKYDLTPAQRENLKNISRVKHFKDLPGFGNVVDIVSRVGTGYSLEDVTEAVKKEVTNIYIDKNESQVDKIKKEKIELTDAEKKAINTFPLSLFKGESERMFHNFNKGVEITNREKEQKRIAEEKILAEKEQKLAAEEKALIEKYQNYPQNGDIRTSKDYIFLADGSYDRAKDNVRLKRPEYFKRLTKKECDFLDENGFYTDKITGYAGSAFLDLRDNSIIISHRGTEMTDPRDLIADLVLVSKGYNIQYESAKKFVEKIMNKYPDNKIEQTGHSLGGSTTQLLAYEYGQKAVTFDAAGTGIAHPFLITPKNNNADITNYVIHKSPISSMATGFHIGEIKEIYPINENIIKATSEHPVFTIYGNAIDHRTSNFKTFDDVAKERWNNNEIIEYKKHIPPTAPYDPYGQLVTIKETTQNYYEGNYDKFKEELAKKYNARVESKNMDFSEFRNQTTEGGHLISSVTKQVFINNNIENGIYCVFSDKNKYVVMINEIDFPRINYDFWSNEFQNKVGEFKFQNPMPEIRSMDDEIGNTIINKSVRGYQNE